MQVIGSNPSASVSGLYATQNQASLTKSIMRLAAGSRLASPADDAAGVAVSGKLNANVKRLESASEGAKNIISLSQASDGFLNSAQSMLTRMSELAQRATDGTLTTDQRSSISQEFNQLKAQISRSTASASFNGVPLFRTDTITTAVDSEGNTDSVQTEELNNTTLGLDSVDISDPDAASDAIQSLNTALDTVTSRRATVNADISRFQFHINNIGTEKINVEAANSRIQDLNVADESTSLARSNILLRASLAMQVQANTSQNSVIGLLR